MSSLNRLIKLARRTGDRLIVHQPTDGADVVIMDIDEYEMLLAEKQDVRDLTERQLLNQINRDIAIWRANEHLEEENGYSTDLTDEEQIDFSDHGDQPKDWHSMSSVLGDRFNISADDFAKNYFDSMEENEEIADSLIAPDNIQNIESNEVKSIEDSDKMNEPTITEVPYKTDLVGEREMWNGEPLAEEDHPVFYEEPLQ